MSPIEIQDSGNRPVEVINGTRLVANIDGMNAADLQAMGFVFPASYSVSQGSPGGAGDNTGLIAAIIPLVIFGFLIFFLMRSAGGSARNQMSDITRS